MAKTRKSDYEPWVEASDRIPAAKRAAAERAFIRAIHPATLARWTEGWKAIAKYANRVNAKKGPG